MIIITGAAGFIGSGIVRRLNDTGKEDLWLVDRLHGHPQGALKEKNLAGKRYERFLDKDEFRRMIRAGERPSDLEAVIHMGACSSTLLTDAAYYEDNNLRYTQEVVAWCAKRDVRLIYASSAATYGRGEHGYDDDPRYLDRLQPLNLYGWSKHKLDLWAQRKGYLDTVVGLKFFNVFGPNETHKGPMRSLIAKAFPEAMRDKRIRLFQSHRPDYEHGEQKRDFIYVKDAVDVVMHFLLNPRWSGLYNVGTGCARSWNELARSLFAACGIADGFIEYIPMPEPLRRQYQYHTEAVVDRLRATGYTKPFTRLEDAVTDYVEYLKNDRRW